MKEVVEKFIGESWNRDELENEMKRIARGRENKIGIETAVDGLIP